MIRHSSRLPRTCAALVPALALLAGASPAQALDTCGELTLGNFQLVSTTPIDATHAQVEISADLTNTDVGTFSSASATWRSTHPQLQIADALLDFGAVGPLATAPSLDTWVLDVPNAAVPVVVGALSAGRVDIDVACSETTAYAGPVVYVDLDTDLAYSTANSTPPTMLEFMQDTPLLQALLPGDILMLDPDPLGYRPQFLPDEFLPLEVVNVTDLGGIIQVDTLPLDLGSAVLNGTFTAGLDQELTAPTGATLSLDTFYTSVDSCEEDEITSCTFGAIPMRFNDVALAPGLTVSGEFLLGATPVDLTVRIRNGLLVEASSQMSVQWTATTQVHAATNVAPITAEQLLFAVPLPAHPVPIGPFQVVVAPVLSVYVGASGELLAGTTFAAHQRGSAGIETGYAGGAYYADPIHDIQPLQISPPELTTDAAAQMETWVEANLELLIDGVAGPHLTAQAVGALTVSPLSDPWYQIEGGVDIEGGFALSLLGFHVADWSSPLTSTRLESLEGYRPATTSGETVRWGVALEGGLTAGSFETHAVRPLGDGSVVIAADHSVDGGYLARVDATGSVLWEQSLGSAVPVQVHPLPGGRLAVTGHTASSFWVAMHDAAGARIWEETYDTAPNPCTVLDSTVFDDGTGPDLFLVGVMGVVPNRNPCMARVDQTGALEWVEEYDLAGDHTAVSVALTSGNEFFVAGQTSADVDTGLVNISPNALLMRMDSAGTVLWSRALATPGPAITSVAAAANGDLLVAGKTSGGPLQGRPSMFVARMDGSGSAASAWLLGQDVDWESVIDGYGSTTAPLYVPPADGNTPYDIARDIVLHADGFYLVGTTGLGSAEEGWVAKLNEDASVQWMVHLDGPLSDNLYAAADAGDGLFVAGASNSYTPLGTGGVSALLLHKLPYEGLVDYSVASLGTSRYHQPMVVSANADPDFLSDAGNNLADVAFTAVSHIDASGAALPAVVGVTSAVTSITP